MNSQKPLVPTTCMKYFFPLVNARFFRKRAVHLGCPVSVPHAATTSLSISYCLKELGNEKCEISRLCCRSWDVSRPKVQAYNEAVVIQNAFLLCLKCTLSNITVQSHKILSHSCTVICVILTHCGRVTQICVFNTVKRYICKFSLVPPHKGECFQRYHTLRHY